MNYEQIARAAATKLGMLDANGNLVEMDSLSLLDFVTELEDRIGTTIPTSHVRRSAFESIATVSQMLSQVKAA